MATAQKPGGLYYTATGQAVDAEGREVKDAPKPPKDTDPSKQLGALGAPTPEERMGRAIAQAIVDPKGTLAAGKPARAAAQDDADDEDEEEVDPPTLADLPDYLADIDDVDEVKALQKKDPRAGAVKIYEARLAELKGE